VAEDYGLITLQDPASPISESYRTLRLNLQFATVDADVRTLLITSPGPGEGKSTTLANLAVTMAQVDQRVIVVDTDLRRPYLHELFHLPSDPGLTTMMLEDGAVEDPPLQDTAVPGLQVLTTGTLPPRPSDLLGSKRMAMVLEALARRADVILLDAPPVMAVTDAVVLATKVDGVLLVVSAGTTKREHAQRAVERLHKVNARVVGAVLNNASLDAALAGYYG